MARHSHNCLHCHRTWKCIDNQCAFHDDAELDEEITVSCSMCRNKGLRFLAEKTAGEPTEQVKPKTNGEALPTKPTANALDQTTKTLNAINAQLGFVDGDKNSIDNIDPQEWVNIYHEYRINYQNLKKIGELLHERKIIVRLESERTYVQKKKEKKREASAKLGRSVKKTPEEKQIAYLMNLPGITEELARKIVADAVAKAKG